jgi:hypothetical protein
MNFRASIITEHPFEKNLKSVSLKGGSQYVLLVRGDTSNAGLSAI